MGKIINYLGFIAVLILLFSMAGITVESPTGYLIGFLKDPSSWSTSALFVKITALLGAVAAGGVVAGIFLRADISLILKVPMTLFLLSLGWDIVGIFNLIKEVNLWLGLLLTAPLALAYGISLIEWWSGSST